VNEDGFDDPESWKDEGAGPGLTREEVLARAE